MSKSKKIAQILILANLALLLINYLLLALKRIDFKFFDFGTQGVIVIFLLGSVYCFKNPQGTRWFGSKLDSTHDVNITVSYVFSSVASMGALMFNLFPTLGH